MEDRIEVEDDEGIDIDQSRTSQTSDGRLLRDVFVTFASATAGDHRQRLPRAQA